MKFTHSTLAKSAVAAVAAAGAFVAVAAPAGAEIVCNGRHECWHVRDHYRYPPRLGLVIHEDAWRAAHQDRRWHWREDRQDHGYYRNGVWRRF
jgi:hypothetical protein